MPKMNQKTLGELEKLLEDSGYRLVTGLNINFRPLAADDCGSYCTGGCRGGCYTCSTGTSQKRATFLNPAIMISEEMIENAVSLVKSAPQKEKR